MRAAFLALWILVAGASGCVQNGQNLSPEQLAALETREIDAPADITFRAAANVALDREWVIIMSDAAAGILAAGHTPIPAAHTHSPAYAVVWVRPLGADRSVVRVKGVGVDPQARRESTFWDALRQRALAQRPAGGSP